MFIQEATPDCITGRRVAQGMKHVSSLWTSHKWRLDASFSDTSSSSSDRISSMSTFLLCRARQASCHLCHARRKFGPRRMRGAGWLWIVIATLRKSTWSLKSRLVWKPPPLLLVTEKAGDTLFPLNNCHFLIFFFFWARVTKPHRTSANANHAKW